MKKQDDGTLEGLKNSLPAQFTDDEQSDPGEGGGAGDGGDGLEDDIDQTQDGAEDQDGADDLDEDADAADEGADDASDEDAEPEAKKPEPTKSEDDKLLEGEKLTKLSGGEFVSKKSFLKRIKKESEGKKALQAQLDAVKPLLERKAEFEDFEKNKPIYEQQNQYIAALRPVLQGDPFIARLLQDKMSGKPTNWAEMTQHLKPYLAPFWDGVEMVEADPTDQALQYAKQAHERVQQWETQQKQEQQKRQQEAQSQEAQQKHIATFSTQEKNVWLKHKAYADQPVFKDMLLSKAEVKQAELDAQGKGQIVNLEQVADELFGQLAAVEAAKRAERLKAREKAKLAGGERSNGIPGIPVKKPDASDKPVDPRAKVKAEILERFGTKFG